MVGQLAARHGIQVRLTESPYGGTTAIVLLPATSWPATAIGDPDDGPGEPERAAALVLTSGRHRLENAAARAQLASVGGRARPLGRAPPTRPSPGAAS